MKFNTVSNGITLNASNSIHDCLDSFNKSKSNCEIRELKGNNVIVIRRKQSQGVKLEEVARIS